MQLEQFGCRLENNLCFSIPSVVLVNLEHREAEQLEDETISQTYVSQVFLKDACWSTLRARGVLQNTDIQVCPPAVHKSMPAYSVLQHSFSIQPS